ncbi:MAG: NAD(+) synthase [Bacilli bacterium]|jgi:NAD+ synthase|nr:NAD(+) synthase [Bacilli bacterium]
MEKYVNYLVKWLQDKVSEAHSNGLIVGVSGGIDSAVVACLIKKAFPNNSLGLILPCYSQKEDVNHAQIVCQDINLDYHIINLDKTYDELINNNISNNIKPSSSYIMAKANTKARLRMTTLYAYAQNYGYLVVGTDNKCEWYTGYFTKFGDGGVDLVPLVHLLKSQVYQLATYFNIDQKIINKAPSAGLIDNQTDEEEMQFSYEELEKYLNGQKVDENIKNRIQFLHQVSEHKRNNASQPLNITEVLSK